MKTFVIAGTHEQGMRWVKQNITDYATTHGTWRSISDYIIVNDVTSLKGFSDPHGVFVGTWRDRKDIRDILFHIHIQSNKVNLKILELIQEFQE